MRAGNVKLQDVEKRIIIPKMKKLRKQVTSSKDRRHSGRYTPTLHHKCVRFDDMKNDALEPREEYDDWINYRDGQRDTMGKERKIKEIKKEHLKKNEQKKIRRRKEKLV